MYLNTIEKASKEFLKRWEKISSDLTAIDTEDADSVKTWVAACPPECRGS
ncbi:MAG: hypothetical protein R3F13_06515 [Prosthecobacter sp.]